MPLPVRVSILLGLVFLHNATFLHAFWLTYKHSPPRFVPYPPGAGPYGGRPPFLQLEHPEPGLQFKAQQTNSPPPPGAPNMARSPSDKALAPTDSEDYVIFPDSLDADSIEKDSFSTTLRPVTTLMPRPRRPAASLFNKSARPSHQKRTTPRKLSSKPAPRVTASTRRATTRARSTASANRALFSKTTVNLTTSTSTTPPAMTASSMIVTLSTWSIATSTPAVTTSIATTLHTDSTVETSTASLQVSTSTQSTPPREIVEVKTTPGPSSESNFADPGPNSNLWHAELLSGTVTPQQAGIVRTYINRHAYDLLTSNSTPRREDDDIDRELRRRLKQPSNSGFYDNISVIRQNGTLVAVAFKS